MSRGLGRVGRAIVGAMRAEPDNALTTHELCECVYPAEPIREKHRGAALRAMRALSRGSTEFGLIVRQGVGAVLYHLKSAQSYAMARGKLEGQPLLRRKWWGNSDGHFWKYPGTGKQHWSRATRFEYRLTASELEDEVRMRLAQEAPEA